MRLREMFQESMSSSIAQVELLIRVHESLARFAIELLSFWYPKSVLQLYIANTLYGQFSA